MKLLARKTLKPEREPLPDDVKKYYREMVPVDSPLAVYFPEGVIPKDHKARFFVMQCQHCFGVHTGTCPAVKAMKLYESGAIKEVVFHDQWNASGIITLEDVFGDSDEVT